MWIHVYDCNNGQNITNATFSLVQAYNRGDGWYWMYSSDPQDFAVNAPGYYSVGGNTDSWAEMYAALCPAPVPSPTYGNCWSG